MSIDAKIGDRPNFGVHGCFQVSYNKADIESPSTFLEVQLVSLKVPAMAPFWNIGPKP